MQSVTPKDYNAVFRVSIPLVLSMSSTTIMEFTDRIFLGNYSLEALAASVPAGITSFLFTSFFMGVAGYTSVFVAQYTGANQKDGVGKSLWQGIYFTLIGGIFMILLSLFAEPIFSFIGHSQEVQVLEVIYFRILCLGTITGLIGTALSGFYSGRGVTTPLLLTHTIGMVINIPLDYALINGVGIFPEWGIKGAAIATVFAWSIITLLLALMVFTKKHNREFHVIKAYRYNPEIFRQLMKFGIPGGVQFFLEILAFTLFVLIIGRLGNEALSLSNIVLSINSIAYMPMFGFSMGLSALTGQAIGAGDPNQAVRYTRATTHIVTAYLLVLTLLFVFSPEPLLKLFIPDGTAPETYQRMLETGFVLMRFLTLYLFFDSFAIIYTGTLKGAGDTRYIMIVFGLIAFLFLFLPLYTGVIHLHYGLTFSWGCLTIYIFILWGALLTRYMNGKWKEMKVI